MTQRTISRAPGVGVLLLIALSACTDSPTFPAPMAAPATPIPVMQCVADVPSQSVACSPAPPAQQNLAIAANRLVGGQDVYVKLASSGTTYDSGTEIFQTNVTVQNLTQQALGTSDGSTVDSVRVFFFSGPTVAAGSGTVTVANPTGLDFFTEGDQPYFGYPEILAPYQISSAVTWQFNVPTTVTRFVFVVYVQAPQPNELLPLLDKQWLGSSNGDWSNALNWSGGAVPDSSSTVAVPPDSLMVGDSMPRLVANTILTNLRVGGGSTVDLSGFSLSAMGNVDALGGITGGTLQMRGTGAVLRGNVPSVVVSGSVSLQGAVVASGAVSVADGSVNVRNQALSISIP